MPLVFRPVEDDKVILCACGDESCYSAVNIIDDTMFVWEDVTGQHLPSVEFTFPPGHAYCVGTEQPNLLPSPQVRATIAKLLQRERLAHGWSVAYHDAELWLQSLEGK